MKYVIKPAPLAIHPAPFTFDDFARYLVATDRRFNTTGPGIRAGMRIEDACEKHKTQPYIELPDEQWQLLAGAAEEPTAGYPQFAVHAPDGNVQPILSARAMLPFVDALRDAKNEPPDALT